MWRETEGVRSHLWVKTSEGMGWAEQGVSVCLGGEAHAAGLHRQAEISRKERMFWGSKRKRLPVWPSPRGSLGRGLGGFLRSDVKLCALSVCWRSVVHGTDTEAVRLWALPLISWELCTACHISIYVRGYRGDEFSNLSSRNNCLLVLTRDWTNSPKNTK